MSLFLGAVVPILLQSLLFQPLLSHHRRHRQLRSACGGQLLYRCIRHATSCCRRILQNKQHRADGVRWLEER